jgi:hypothetical protein
LPAITTAKFSSSSLPGQSKSTLCSSECTLPIMLPETCDDLDPCHAFIGKEFENVALFNFHDFDICCLMDQLLPAKFAQWPISTAVLFTYRNRRCSGHFHVTHFVNGQPRKESPGRYRTPCVNARKRRNSASCLNVLNYKIQSTSQEVDYQMNRFNQSVHISLSIFAAVIRR